MPNERPRTRHLGPASFLELFLESRARWPRYSSDVSSDRRDWVGSALGRARTPTRARLAAAHASHACSRDTRARHSSGARPDRLLRLRAARRPPPSIARRAKRWKKHTERREMARRGERAAARASFARARRAVVMVATCVHDAPARPLTRLAFLSVPPTQAFSRASKRRRTRHGKLFPAVRATADHDKKKPDFAPSSRHSCPRQT